MPQFANRSVQLFIITLSGIAAVSTLMGTGTLATDVGAPILSGLVLGGAGAVVNPPSNP